MKLENIVKIGGIGFFMLWASGIGAGGFIIYLVIRVLMKLAA